MVQDTEVEYDPSGIQQAGDTLGGQFPRTACFFVSITRTILKPILVNPVPGTLAEPQAERIIADPVSRYLVQDEGVEPGTEGDNGGDDAGVQQVVCTPELNANTGCVTSLATSPDNRWVARGSDDTTIILWETDTQSVVRKWESHNNIVWHLAFSPDSLRLASSGGEGRIMIWDINTGEQLAILEGHTDTIHTVVWSPDGTKLASGSDDMMVRIWDAQTYEQMQLLEGHDAMVTFVLFSHNGRLAGFWSGRWRCPDPSSC